MIVHIIYECKHNIYVATSEKGGRRKTHTGKYVPQPFEHLLRMRLLWNIWKLEHMYKWVLLTLTAAPNIHIDIWSQSRALKHNTPYNHTIITHIPLQKR